MNGIALLRSQRGLMAKTARALGITRSAVAQWRVVPADQVIAVEAASGIAREDLRPDLYRAAEQAAA